MNSWWGLTFYILRLHGRNFCFLPWNLLCKQKRTFRVTRLKGRRRLRVFIVSVCCVWWLKVAHSPVASHGEHRELIGTDFNVYVFCCAYCDWRLFCSFCSCSTVGASQTVRYNCTATTNVYFHPCDLSTFVFDTLLIKSTANYMSHDFVLGNRFPLIVWWKPRSLEPGSVR